MAIMSTPLPPTALPTLRSLSTMLARYVYHFSNGDRHQLSFRHVRAFYRELARLVAEADDDAVLQARLGKRFVQKDSGKVGARVRRWEADGRVEEWFLAFSQMMVDSNAAKSVFLIALLAEVVAVLGIVDVHGLADAKKGEVEELAGSLGMG